jgi:4-amino-4-deoxy-L-arabinose transferase-like glycosyltransferase
LTATEIKTEPRESKVDCPSVTARDWLAQQNADIAAVLVVASVAIATTLIWFSFDQRIPTQDEARHIMNSMAFRDLLLHSRPWQYGWWHHCFTIDPLYPPFVYAVNGTLLLIFGQSRFSEQLGASLFTGILVAALYGITRLLQGTRRAGCFAALFGATYPIMSRMSHTYFLDLPEAAMTAVALMILVLWRSSSKPTIAKTLLSGFALGIVCLTKQLVTICVFPAGAYFLVNDLVIELFHRNRSEENRRISWLTHTVLLGIVTLIVGLPFILSNYQWNINRINGNLQAFAAYGAQLSYGDRLAAYWHQLPAAMSPMMLCVFVLSILLLKQYPKLTPIAVSAIGGIYLLSAFPSEGQDWRYFTPFLIAPAIMSGMLIDRLFSSPMQWQRGIGVAVITIVLCSYFIRNFSPYPLPLFKETVNSSPEDDQNPRPYADWGYAFVAKTIARTDGNRQIFLNILPNHQSLNVNAFLLYLSEEMNQGILPTSSRSWTIVGDRFDFDPPIAKRYQWYLLKTGDIGYRFCDQRSASEYTKLVSYITESGDYSLKAEKQLPDGSYLKLYRKTF